MTGALLQELSNVIWLINKPQADQYLPQVLRFVRGENGRLSSDEIKALVEERNRVSAAVFVPMSSIESAASDKFKRPKSQTFSLNSAIDIANLDKEGVVIVSLKGPMIKTSGMCQKGTEETLAEIRAAGDNANVKGVVLNVFSPGGSVFGTEQLSTEIANFEAKYGKALAAYIDGQACSAAYWAASGASKIFLAGDSTEVGCIGTMITLVDDSKMQEAMGVRTVMVRATHSSNKNQAYVDAMTGNTIALQTEILDPLNDAFLKAVKNNRKKAEVPLNTKDMTDGVPTVLTGKTYYGKSAISQGLADEIASIDDVIRWVENRTKKMQSEAAKLATTSKTQFVIGQHLAPNFKTNF